MTGIMCSNPTQDKVEYQFDINEQLQSV